ncbi:MAG: ABC transporter ATP-binding protein [Verrucomicrobiaceae bacterium]|nr:ABC transporter ATP-binding protein [Verrucomicrobiaceae bacterium]
MVTIRISSLVKRFGDVVALDHLDLDIAAGELFFLLGPSGSGKTTLLRAIAGLHLPDAGTIHFDEDDVTRLPPHRRETGMMFQSYALWPHLNVFRNVAFGLEERRVPKTEIRRRVDEALAMVKMDGLGARRVHELSGGQQQRVALARALVIRPRCLLLDEPLSNLDSKLRVEMRAEIRRICKEFGLTAVYVTHDQKEALSMADRMAVLDAGKIVQTGTPVDLYRRPRSAFVSSFVGETNLIEGTIATVSGDEYSIHTETGDLSARLAAPDWKPAPGDLVILSIRPECLSLHVDPPAENAITGRLIESVYLGETAQYSLKCEERETPLHISELNPHRVIRDTETRFHATAKPEDIVILKS